MLVRIQNLRANNHGFGSDPRLQFGPGESKEVDSEWLKPFENKAGDALFDENAKGGAAFRVVPVNSGPTPLEALRLEMKQVPKPPEDLGPLAPASSNAPKSEADFLAALNG